VIIVECTQGSEEWHAARAGVITASMFKVARERVGMLSDQQLVYVQARLAGASEADACRVAGYKKAPTAEVVRRALRGERIGELSNAAKDYAFRLAIERISGMPLDEGFETWQIRRGHELEPMARMEHEAKTGLLVETAGFVLTDDRLFGGSADGLIDPKGGSEYKCLVSPERLRSVLIDGDISEFADQVQGCMWITEREWWHLCFYCPALEPIGKQLTIIECKRDDDYIESMEADLVEFAREVERMELALRCEGVSQSKPAPQVVASSSALSLTF